MKKKLYHITSVDKIDSILENGLRANEYGDIYLFDNVSIRLDDRTFYVADHIAKNQIFCDTYAMFEVDVKGIHKPIKQDVCGELTTKQQYVVNQKVINKKHISIFGIFDVEM